MRLRNRWLAVITALALAFVAVSCIVQAAQQRSWGPIAEGLWLPAVAFAACWPGTYRRCLPRRRRRAG